MDIKREPKSKKKQYIMWGAGIVAIVAVTLGISTLKPAAPSAERATMWVDVVKRGELLREVRAAGTLVPEHMRIIAAVTAGRIEALPVRPGVTVTPGTMLVEMSNTDVELQALQAEQSLTGARSGLATLKSSLQQQRMSQEANIAQLKTQLDAALRRLKEIEGLASKNLASQFEISTARESASELQKRYDIETARLAEMERSAAEQIALNNEQVARLNSIVGEQRNRVNSMRVVAGEQGVLQSLGPSGTTLELGQWVNPGMELARVARPGALKAVIRVPETQARDIAVGQKAKVDTRNGIVDGHVMRIDPGSTQGTVIVEIAIDGELPRGARADMSVDGTIEIERLPDVMYVGRPAYGSAESTVGLFKLSEDGSEANLVTVKLGRASVNLVEIIPPADGSIAVGDSIIISDISQWDNQTRIRIKR